MNNDAQDVPGFLFFDYVAIAVKQGELETPAGAYKTLGFTEVIARRCSRRSGT
jgi:hypothetical protein